MNTCLIIVGVILLALLIGKLTKKVKGSPEYMAQLREKSEIIRDKLIREVMIRRTRGEVQKYYAADLEAQSAPQHHRGNRHLHAAVELSVI